MSDDGCQLDCCGRKVLLDALYWMYVQYCEDDGHYFMAAGQNAARLLEEAGYITVDAAGTVIADHTGRWGAGQSKYRPE